MSRTAADPGLAFRTTTLPDALALVARAWGVQAEVPVPDIADEILAVEEAATAIGLRSRRVLLDGRWWLESGMPMLARLVDRRRVAREGDQRHASLAGWVALLPRPSPAIACWRSAPPAARPWNGRWTRPLAQRLAPFAFASTAASSRIPSAPPMSCASRSATRAPTSDPAG